MKKIIAISSIIITMLIVSYLVYNKELGGLGKPKFRHKVFYSDNGQNKVTLLLHTVGEFNHYDHIYIIDGEYYANKIPEGDKYIKFPDSTGVYIEWVSDYICNIVCDAKPEVNNIIPLNYKVNLEINRAKIDTLMKDNKVIRYGIHLKK